MYWQNWQFHWQKLFRENSVWVKKMRQISVVIHYCDLSRFFWLRRKGVGKFWTIKSSWIHCAAWWRIQASLYCFDMAVKQTANVLCRRVERCDKYQQLLLDPFFTVHGNVSWHWFFYSWLSSLGGRIFVLIIFTSIIFENTIDTYKYIGMGFFHLKMLKPAR